MEVFLALSAVAALTAFVRDRRKLDRLEQRIREIRTVLAADFPYRVPARDDAELCRLLDDAVRSNAPFLSLGLTQLGDLVFAAPDGPPIGIMRAFVDADRTTIAYVTLYPALKSVSLLLESYATDGEYVTHVGNPVRASAPFSRQQTVAATTSYGLIFTAHRSFAKAADIRITTLDELIRELRRNHTMFKKWRESMSPDDLLEADLRNAFGDAYEVHGARWKRRLALRLPQATLRR